MNHRCTVQKDSFPTRCERVYLKEKGCHWGSVKNDATFATSATPATQNCFAVADHCLPQHALNFLPLPQGHGSLRPIFIACRSSPGRYIIRTFSSGKNCHLKSPLTFRLTAEWKSAARFTVVCPMFCFLAIASAFRRFYPLVNAQNALLPLRHATTIAPLTLVSRQCVRCFGQVLKMKICLLCAGFKWQFFTT